MKRRLFWKILIGFIITFTGISVGVWSLLMLYGGPPEPFHIGYLKRTAPGYLQTAAEVARHGGVDELEATIAHWPKSERSRLIIDLGSPGSGGTVDGANSADNASAANSTDMVARVLPDNGSPEWLDALKEYPAFEQVVTGPGGENIRLIFDVSDVIAEIPQRSRWKVPNPLIILGSIGGLVFSGVLAWYLTRPILKISDGFEELSRGNLDYRLGKTIGRRRDEIADLARDFDVMADRLQRLVAARDRLLNDVSHELRSPLARMQLAVGLARQSPDKSATSLDRIEKEAVRLDELVGELLTLSRAESGAARHQSWIDLDHLLGRVVSDARFEADATGVIVDADFGARPSGDHNVPVLMGSPELLRRAFENVVRNALRHSGEGQIVKITATDDTDHQQFRIDISDEGPGIDGDKLDELFEPFVRGQSNAWGGGFGLGLSIAQRAIRAHGGDIKIRNRDQGGLLVTILLPYELRQAEV
ncbi:MULTISPECIES: ATP-binding protein [unclassified Thalassospira]|uniref:HAMP domain-containing sensor histidine kinase n=1 Tax=unclassified Thalassospira TaxID=2648997 RepID=UPI001B0F9430|nr:ATP-binding protein [Thalassospira sp.]MBO6773120.1 HAMP domain-containing protein [Thalassospira sp.]